MQSYKFGEFNKCVLVGRYYLELNNIYEVRTM